VVFKEFYVFQNLFKQSTVLMTDLKIKEKFLSKTNNFDKNPMHVNAKDYLSIPLARTPRNVCIQFSLVIR